MTSDVSDLLLTTASGGMTTLELHRPDRRNALDDALVDLLLEELRAAQRRGDAAVVLTGGPEYFSSGGDVATMRGPEDGVLAPAARLTRIHDLIIEMTRSDLVTIAAVEGFAVGAAWGIVLGCDVVVAAVDAFFVAPFAARGLTADAGTAFHLPRRLGQHRAAAHLYFGERLSAADAHAAGLVTEVAPSGSATTRAQDLGRYLAAGPRESNSLTKSQINRGYAGELVEFLNAERVSMSLAGHGRNATEGRSAFLERREPRF